MRVVNMNVNRVDLGPDVSKGSCHMCYISGTISQKSKCVFSIEVVCLSPVWFQKTVFNIAELFNVNNEKS